MVTTTKRVSEQKREAVFQAALQEFNERGFLATSMDRIAARAGVSKRTVYNHFASKEALFRAITEDLIERVSQAARIDYDPAATLESQLTRIGEQEMAMLLSPDFLRLARVVLAEHLRSPELSREVFENLQSEELGLVVWIRRAVEDGRLKAADPRKAADQFLALIKTFAFWPLLFCGEAPPDAREQGEIIRSAVAMFLDHYAR
ncbi:MAG: TetR/AcrR family transcriptional regulator [Gammaproteobacteria bacterium]